MVLAPKKPISSNKLAAAATDSSGTPEALADWSALPGGVVDGGELVILAIKPSMWRPFIESSGWILACSLLAILIARMNYALPGWSLSATVQMVICVGFVRLAYALIRWIPRWYLLTNRRIMDVEGIREPRVWSCRLEQIRNTYVQATLIERILGVGNITVVTEDPNIKPRCWRAVANPDQVHAVIRRSIEDAIDRQNF
ncbi:MAG: PH domain-containing protein [Planctomycetota bacterium]|jgi:hypothetical protein